MADNSTGLPIPLAKEVLKDLQDQLKLLNEQVKNMWATPPHLVGQTPLVEDQKDALVHRWATNTGLSHYFDNAEWMRRNSDLTVPEFASARLVEDSSPLPASTVCEDHDEWIAAENALRNVHPEMAEAVHRDHMQEHPFFDGPRLELES